MFGLGEGERILSHTHPVVRFQAGRSESSNYFPVAQEDKTVLNVLAPGVDKNFHNFIGAAHAISLHPVSPRWRIPPTFTRARTHPNSVAQSLARLHARTHAHTIRAGCESARPACHRLPAWRTSAVEAFSAECLDSRWPRRSLASICAHRSTPRSTYTLYSVQILEFTTVNACL